MDTVESAVYDDYSVSGVFPVFFKFDIEKFPAVHFERSVNFLTFLMMRRQVP